MAGPLKNLTDKLKSKEQREQERHDQLRAGYIRINQNIKKQRAMSQKLWDLAKRALTLGDQQQFKQIGQRYLLTVADINRKERYVVMIQALETQLDQSHLGVEFMEAIKGITGAVAELTTPQNMAAMQREVEDGLARAEAMTDRLDTLMELATDSMYTADQNLSEERLKDMENAMLRDGASQGATSQDARIDELLNKIAEEMKGQSR